jgi:CheY-like chemotaxis protein
MESAAAVLVLVVDDEVPIQHILEDALTDGGFTVAFASTGKEALAMLDAAGADYAALVTDINLPGKASGWDVARHAREINAAIPVVYMTGAAAHEWASQGVPNSQLMPKPFAPAQVVLAVTQMINAAAKGSDLRGGNGTSSA